MRGLPAGRFVQGAAAGAAFEQPEHEVNIAHPFAAAQREVTVGEFQEFVEATGHDASGCAVYDGEWQMRADARWSNVDNRQTAMHAVSCVSWSDAVTYAEWLSKKTGHSYRLPSASEWEYAARAGSSAAQPWQTDAEACGSGNVADQHAAQLYPGWTVYACDDGYAQVAPVGAFTENAFGLQDTLGNVFEWVQDCWHDDYVDSPTTGAARLDGNCVEREMRGGSWFTPPEYISVSYRNRFAADYRSSSVGFRVVREIPE